MEIRPASDPHISRTIDLPDGRALHAECHPGQGESLVLLHGLLDSAVGWREFAGASPRPCVAIDLPGFGRSDLPSRPEIAAYAHDVAAALDGLAVGERFAVVGHSFGGAVAAALAELVPARISALVLLAPAGFGRIALAEVVSVPGVRRAVQLTLPLLLRHRLPMEIAYRGVITNNHAPAPEVLDRVTESAGALVPAARQATEAVVAAGRSPRAFHRRRLAYDGPVTALWGTNDRVVPPSHCRGVCTAFPQAETVTWDKMGHHPQRERFEHLLAFVAAACDGSGVGHAVPRVPETTGRDWIPSTFSPLPIAA